MLVSGGCLQNWQATDACFTFAAKLMIKAMGFIKPHNVGPAWLKKTKPPAADLLGILDLDFAHVLPAHGRAVISGAKAGYRPRIEALRNTTLKPRASAPLVQIARTLRIATVTPSQS